MKKKLFSFLAIAAIAAVPGAMFAATSTTATSTATVTVGTPLTVTKTIDLAFGNILATTTAGTYALSADGVVTATNVTSNGGTATAAVFTVSGTASTTYAITLPAANTVALKTADGVNSIPVASFVAKSSNAAATAGAGKTATTGADTFSVGATLTIAANQVSGVYSGDFAVTVAYN